MAKKKKRTMSDEHKAALALGRQQGRAVRDYLSVLDREKRRGPKMTPERLQERIDELATRIEAEDDLTKRVELIQKRMDYEDRLAEIEDAPDVDALTDAFVDAVKGYSERKNISYSAWRELGVPADVLKRGGVPRTRRTVSA